MKKQKDYIIPFSNLKEGLHEFVFEADDQFFELFENPDIPGGKIQSLVKLQKYVTFMELDFFITGTVRTICDRCLDELNLEICTEEKLFIRFGEDFREIDNNIIVIPKEENRIDISQFIYEFTVLNFPVKRVHSVDENEKSACNPEMLDLLKRHSRESEILKDPVWNNLKNIKY